MGSDSVVGGVEVLRRKVRGAACLAVGCVLLLVAGCGSDATDNGNAGVTGAPSTTVESPGDIAAACATSTAAFEDWIGTGADDAYAAKLEQLASGEAAGTRLEGPLREMVDGLRRGDASIPDVVGPICRGKTPTTLAEGEADRQSRYLAAVRAAVPGIVDGDNDLIASIDLACDLLDSAHNKGRIPTNRDQLMAMAWPPLNDLDDAEHVLREGVPLYCPEYGDLVEQLL